MAVADGMWMVTGLGMKYKGTKGIWIVYWQNIELP
jgi:hypothetical protein